MIRRALYAIALVALWIVPGLVTAAVNIALFPQIASQGIVLLHVGGQMAAWVVWAALTPIVAMTVRRHPLERGQLGRSLAWHGTLAAACAAVYVVWLPIVSRATSTSSVAQEQFGLVFRSQLGARATLAVLMYAAIAGVTVAMDEGRRRRTRDLQTARLEADLARAQLQALQMQLQPHFLFNTLHAIGMLVQEDPAKASATIIQLGDLLRRTLALADVPEIALREELEILRDYLRIEETRFGDRLAVTIDAPAELLTSTVPSFILQPIVENAVRHGVAPRTSPGHITVRARRAGSSITIEVEDDGPGFATGDTRDGGIGLAATRARLEVLYGQRASVACDEGPGGGALVRVSIPSA
jgi:signal transduction histidine kinase